MESGIGKGFWRRVKWWKNKKGNKKEKYKKDWEKGKQTLGNAIMLKIILIANLIIFVIKLLKQEYKQSYLLQTEIFKQILAFIRFMQIEINIRYEKELFGIY